MFALIDTKNATHIAIHVPHEGAEKTLPALAAMLEQNAVFIREGYQELGTVTPSMQIILGNQYRVEHYGQELMVLCVPEDKQVIGEDFVIASPAVFASAKKGLAEKEAEIGKLRTELAYVKDQLSRANAQIKALEQVDNAE